MLVWWLLGMHSDGVCVDNNVKIRWQQSDDKFLR
jgi:hypothetical protein